MAAYARLKNDFTEDEKCHNLMRWLKFLFPEAMEAFNLFDKDNDRGLDLDELCTVFKALGQRPSVPEVEDILETYDVNSELTISFYLKVYRGKNCISIIIFTLQET